MTTGEWRDGFPRVSLTLVGMNGPVEVNFIVDTGFNGDVALPENLMSQLGLVPTAAHYVELAGGFRQRCFSYEMMLEWEGDERLVEVLTLDGNPLIGNGLWQGALLHAENEQGGEVSFQEL